MRDITLAAIVLLSTCASWAQASIDDTHFSGQVRLLWTGQQVTSAVLPAQAIALQSGPPPMPVSSTALETELRTAGHGLSSIVTLQQLRPEDGASQSHAWANELYASHDAGVWQFSAGKKIVAWDVGYGFRPNDVVQQEERRTLVSSTAQGRPLLMAEHFSASTAWSWVWVNPSAASDAPGATEPALAARVYQRDAAVDWHGFARVGAHSGASLGAAAAWVASDALELHASLRNASQLKQALIGGTWTNQSQLSVLTEAWWDGGAVNPLRSNRYLRLSWQHEEWQPALDLLYLPLDQSRVVTASVIWQGDRLQWQCGLRHYAGSTGSMLLQSPLRGSAYLAASWTF